MSLFATLASVSDTLRAFERGLSVTQNNVANASTPGFSRQSQSLVARPFQLQQGLMGGVESGIVLSSRNIYAERTVWREQHLTNGYAQRQNSLSEVESILTIAEGAGVPDALNGLFGAFSQLTVSPNDALLRQNAIEKARVVASQFRESAHRLNGVAQNADGELRTAVQRINALAAQISEINVARRNNFEMRQEPGSDATLHSTLEQLAQLADFTVLQQPDGTVSVLLGGQHPLTIGDRTYPVSIDINSSAATLRTGSGDNITGYVKSGQLGALLEFRNTTLPSYQNKLDQLAASVTTEINAVLFSGLDQSNATPLVGLFGYNAALGAASSMYVTGIQPEELALATATAPGGNGNALRLTALADQAVIGTETFTQFYSTLASRVGNDLGSARQSADTHQLLLTQARALREDVSGVSLDEEAAKLIEFQRAYQAAAQLFKVVDEMTQELLSLRG